MSWFVYLLECTGGSIYTGITKDVQARFKVHRQGKGGSYTRAHPPLRILATESHPDRSAASQAEYRIKQLSVVKKRAYIAALQANFPCPGAPVDNAVPGTRRDTGQDCLALPAKSSPE